MLGLLAAAILAGLQDPAAERKALELLPDLIKKYEADDLDGVAEVLERMIKMAPASGTVLALRGEYLLQRNRPEAAAKDLDRAFELGVDPAEELRYRLARAWARLGIVKHAAAMEDVTKILAKEPQSPQALFALAVLALRMGAHVEVVKASERLMAVDPKNGFAYGLRAQAHFQKGRLEEAVADYREALRLRPGEPIAASCLAVTLATQGNKVAALAAFEKDLAEGPMVYSGLWIWRLRLEGGEPDAALRALETVKKSAHVHDANPWHRRVAAHLAGELPEQDLLKAAAEGTPAEAAEHRTEALFFAGLRLLRAGDKAAAAERFRGAKAGAPWALESVLADLELKRLEK